ncbi:TonB family protein [Shewanella sp. 1_MG-2023]|uniref:energy transducer TonB n=1 Tax=unclassified Shewanella TaxID=196818 RepID=UPI0026E46C02|nr:MULTISPECIES: energy transducer TonB [unclassified Shewanella]MDO6612052.1 TonB family protein [Shewanella sp. 7_MG-2023]MDO6771872.1 TonB family protein [Shewanella sp. 2_MG-2023]MDO6794216.1 TonB family protein [Shewanella sp. 1_MG-2023]
MTPKRYFAFGCLTILIQGGVLASQNSEPSIQLSEGAAMGSNKAVSVMIAMQVSTQATSIENTVEEVKKPEHLAKPKPVVKPKPEPVVKAAPKKPAAEKVITKIEQAKTSVSKPSVSKPETSKPETAEQPPAEVTEDASTDASATHNQQQVDAKQGVTQETVALQQPTFSAPPAQPNYPKKARKRGFEGTATVEVMFNQIGEQLSLTLVDSSGYSLLDAAAINAVEQWQFAAPSPQTAFAYTVRVPVKFALN